MHTGTFRPLSLLLPMAVIASSCAAYGLDYKAVNNAPVLRDYQVNELLISDAAKKTKEKSAKENSDKKAKSEKEEVYKEPVIKDAVEVTTMKLVGTPKNYLGKNIKFKSNFFAFSNLALNYKPAYRPQKEYISFLVYRPKSKVPFSELKLAMKIPKEKDPRNKMLTSLHDGDTIEVTGKVFSTALDEPWVDVLNLKKLASAKKDKDKDKKSEEKSTTKDKK